MVKKLSCVSCGSLKRFPHTFTTGRLAGNSEGATFITLLRIPNLRPNRQYKAITANMA